MDDKVWLRQENETDNVYNYFTAFLEMRPPRNLRELSEEIGIAYGYIRRVSSEHNWTDRARAYDNYMQTAAITHRAEALSMFQEVVLTEEVSDYQTLRRLWQQAANRLTQQQASMDDAEFMAQLRRLSQTRAVIDKMARTAAQMPTSYRAIEQTVTEKSEDGPITLTLPGLRSLPDGDDDDD